MSRGGSDLGVEPERERNRFGCVGNDRYELGDTRCRWIVGRGIVESMTGAGHR